MILGVIPMRELPLLLAVIALVSAGIAGWLWLRWRKPDRKPEYAGMGAGGDGGWAYERRGAAVREGPAEDEKN